MIDCKSSFAYNGCDFTLVGDEVAAQVAGSAVVLWNTRTGEKDYIWSKRNGYCVACANYNNGFIAAAEYGLNPEVHIYRYPTKELVYKFGMDTTVKCIAMAFSRDGRYLLMVGGVPDFRISIFDVENNKKLVIPDTKLPCKPEEFVSAKFNPSNKSNFAILS
jgi:WD40 repeat protein